jgi:hypothetical protein
MKTSQAYIARVEGGKVRPLTDALERFAQATRTRSGSYSNRNCRANGRTGAATDSDAPTAPPFNHLASSESVMKR